MNERKYIAAIAVIALLMVVPTQCVRIFIDEKGTYGSMCTYRINAKSKSIEIKSSFDKQIVYYNKRVNGMTGIEFYNYEDKKVAEINLISGLKIYPTE